MRILFCTERDLAGCLILNELLPRLVQQHDVLTWVSDNPSPLLDAPPELHYLRFVQWDLPVQVLFPLIDGLEREPGTLLTFAGASRTFGNVELVTEVDSEGARTRVAQFQPDLIISARFSFIFPPDLFGLAKFGAFNVHPGKLPEYAGRFSPIHALIDGATELGCTLHQIDDGIDSGPIVGTGYLRVDRRRTLLWHVLRSYRPGLELFLGMLNRVELGLPVETTAQNRASRKYRRYPPADDLAVLCREWPVFESSEYASVVRLFLPPADELLADRVGSELLEIVDGRARLA